MTNESDPTGEYLPILAENSPPPTPFELSGLPLPEPDEDGTITIVPDTLPGTVSPEKPRKIRSTPGQQGTRIPRGWKPSYRQPIPVVQCTHVWADDHHSPDDGSVKHHAGERCGLWSLRGSLFCYYHGGRGSLKQSNDYAAAMVEAARLNIYGFAPEAVDVITGLAKGATSESVRLKAATEVLDRAGVRGGTEVDVIVEHAEAPAEAIRKRLLLLRQRARETPLPEQADEVVDAEVVEDDTLNLTLPFPD